FRDPLHCPPRQWMIPDIGTWPFVLELHRAVVLLLKVPLQPPTSAHEQPGTDEQAHLHHPENARASPRRLLHAELHYAERIVLVKGPKGIEEPPACPRRQQAQPARQVLTSQHPNH